MRTTVTIESDLAERLKRRARERDASFKSVLNDAIRRGLDKGNRPQADEFVQRTSALSLQPGVDLTKANQLAGELEDAEIARKLEQGR